MILMMTFDSHGLMTVIGYWESPHPNKKLASTLGPSSIFALENAVMTSPSEGAY